MSPSFVRFLAAPGLVAVAKIHRFGAAAGEEAVKVSLKQDQPDAFIRGSSTRAVGDAHENDDIYETDGAAASLPEGAAGIPEAAASIPGPGGAVQIPETATEIPEASPHKASPDVSQKEASDKADMKAMLAVTSDKPEEAVEKETETSSPNNTLGGMMPFLSRSTTKTRAESGAATTPAAKMSLATALPFEFLKNLLGSQTKQSSKYLFDSFLAEQPRLRGKISESTELKKGDVGSENHSGWCPWLQQEERTETKPNASVDVVNVATKADLSWWSKDKAEAIKDEAQHMCADSIWVWNEYVASAEKDPTQYPNAANAARIDDIAAKRLCGAFDLRQSLNYCSSEGPGLVVRVVGAGFNGGRSHQEFADISENEYPIFLSASVVNQKHSIVAGGLGVGIMFEKERGNDREIVVVAGGKDLWTPTDYYFRTEAKLDSKSMENLIQEYNGMEKEVAKKVLVGVFDQRRQRQLQMTPTDDSDDVVFPDDVFPDYEGRICVNKSWLKQQGWTKSETQPQHGTLLRFLTHDPRQQQDANCKERESFVLFDRGNTHRAFSENDSEALEFALSDTPAKHYNEVVVDITGQNVHAIWMMETNSPDPGRGERIEITAAELFAAYVAKFHTQPLFVRIFQQAGAVFQLISPVLEQQLLKKYEREGLEEKTDDSEEE